MFKTIKYSREAEHDGGAVLAGDEGSEVPAGLLDLLEVLGIDNWSCHFLREVEGERGETIGEEKERENGVRD